MQKTVHYCTDDHVESDSEDEYCSCNDCIGDYVYRLDPENLRIRDEFDPTRITYEYEFGYHTYSRSPVAAMHFWIKYHPEYKVPDELVYPVELFKITHVQSPLISWIICNKGMEIPDYLFSYLEVGRIYSDVRSCLMQWLQSNSVLDVPQELWKEIDFHNPEYDSDVGDMNALCTWIVYRNEPIPQKLMYQFDLLDNYAMDYAIEHWIEFHQGQPLPDTIVKHIEQTTIGDRNNICARCIETTLVGQWLIQRPDEPIPRALVLYDTTFLKFAQKESPLLYRLMVTGKFI